MKEVKGQKLTTEQKRKLYQERQTSNQQQTLFGKPNEAIVVVNNDCTLRHDMSVGEMCLFVSKVAPLHALGYWITGIAGSGSYGLVLDLINADGVPYVMKVSRISEERGEPIRFPILNNQKTSWHTIGFTDFKRGVRSQQRVCKNFKNIRIPKILHAGCVDLCSKERLGLIIMQKVNGKTLRKVLQCDSVSVDVKHLLIRKAGKMVAQFHRSDIIHGDAHVWNMLCDASGHLYMIDFDRTSRSSDSAHRLHDLGKT